MVPPRCRRRLRSYGTLRGAELQLDTDVSERPVGPTVSPSSSPCIGLSDRLVVPKRLYGLTYQNSDRHLPHTERQAEAKDYRTDTIFTSDLIFLLVFATGKG